MRVLSCSSAALRYEIVPAIFVAAGADNSSAKDFDISADAGLLATPCVTRVGELSRCSVRSVRQELPSSIDIVTSNLRAA